MNIKDGVSSSENIKYVVVDVQLDRELEKRKHQRPQVLRVIYQFKDIKDKIIEFGYECKMTPKFGGSPVSFCRVTSTGVCKQKDRIHPTPKDKQGACTSIVRQTIDKAPYAIMKAALSLPFF
jgi:hypothetical protein